LQVYVIFNTSAIVNFSWSVDSFDICVFFFKTTVYLDNRALIGKIMNGKDFEGSSHGLIEVKSQHLPEETKESHEPDVPARDTNRAPP
jgi:hypothetical protein